MVHIRIKKGLDIPINGAPRGNVQLLPHVNTVGITFSPYDTHALRLFVKEGDLVAQDEAIVYDAHNDSVVAVAPDAGRVKQIVRGPKRVLQAIIIERIETDRTFTQQIEHRNAQEILNALSRSGLFFSIRKRPFDTLARPQQLPRSIFVQAVATAPFAPPPELDLIGFEEEFQYGLSALTKLAPVHLVYSAKSTAKNFLQAVDVQHHTVEGPHPAGNPSVHIAHIDPIQTPEDCIWTFTAWEVLALGHYLHRGHTLNQRVISIAGEGVKESARGYLRAPIGASIGQILRERLVEGCGKKYRIIAGDPLTGRTVFEGELSLCLLNDTPPATYSIEHMPLNDQVLGFRETILSIIPVEDQREPLHFFRLGTKKYTASHTYISGFFQKLLYRFTTSQHGEERAFIDGSIYERVMPLPILPMQIAKACLAEDFDKAREYGLIEAVAEDFALCEFVCPSKVKMMDIIRRGLAQYSKEVLGK